MNFFKSELLKPIIIITFIFLCIIASIKIVGQIPLYVDSIQTNKSDFFQVQGTGKVAEIPNSAQFSFGVTKTASTVSDAQNQTNGAVTSILNSITALGVEAKDIITTNYSVSPEYSFDNNGNQIPNRYTVTQNIEIKVNPIEKASKILDIATANGANLIGGISFTFDDVTENNLEEKAREEAIKNAKDKAQSLAHAAGVHLGKIVNISEDEINNIRPLPLMAGGPVNSDKTQIPTQLPSGENVINSSVTISYEIY